ETTRPDRPMLEDVPALHDLQDGAADDVIRIAVMDGLALELDRALRDVPALGAQQARDRLERGRLAGAVGPEESDDAPLGDLERHALQDEDDVVVDDLHVVD